MSSVLPWGIVVALWPATTWASEVRQVPVMVSGTPPVRMELPPAPHHLHSPPREVPTTRDGQAYLVRFGTTVATQPFDRVTDTSCACDTLANTGEEATKPSVHFLLAEPPRPRPLGLLGTCHMQGVAFALHASHVHAPPPWSPDPGAWIVPYLPDDTAQVVLTAVPRRRHWSVDPGVCTLTADARGPGGTLSVILQGFDDGPVRCASSRQGDAITLRRIPFGPIDHRDEGLPVP